MAEVTYDGNSISIDGRRIWLVSGQMDYARIPSGLWRSRLRAARQAGLNCIATRVPWNAHEQEPGGFNFEGDLDLRAFVQTAQAEGLYCILQPGPFVGGGYDFGGLPAYLHGVTGKKDESLRLRQNETLFMQAVNRFFRALMRQVSDLQAASPGGGPIALMQAEQAWLSHNPGPGEAYLEALVSILRQQGCVVPIVNTNNLWQPVEGTIDTWNGGGSSPAILRQLSQIQTEAPPMVMSLTIGGVDPWSDAVASSPGSDDLLYQLAGLAGVGAQFNIDPFHAGSPLGFNSVGHLPANAPLGKAGERGQVYPAIKRLGTFLSEFGYVLASRDGRSAPTVALGGEHPTALLHQRGSQGQMVMLIKSAKDKTVQTPVMLPNGLSLDVPHGGQRAAWVLLDTNLGGIASLDYTSLSPWALIDKKLLVVFGPEGAQGVVCVDGQHTDITVPKGKTPTVIEGETIHIAVLNPTQIDAATITDDALLIGCDGTDEDGSPLPLAGWGTVIAVHSDGSSTRKRISPTMKPPPPKLGPWQALSLKNLVEGVGDAFEPIGNPADLGALGQAFGYGWYRFAAEKAGEGKLLFTDAGDRLHAYQEGKLVNVFGDGEGATAMPAADKLTGEIVVLADNHGRIATGQQVGQDKKGLAGHAYTVKPLKVAKAKRVKQAAGDPFAIHALAHQQRAGARPMSEALEWTVKLASRKPVILEWEHGLGLSAPCVLTVNDTPLRFDAAEHLSKGVIRVLLDPADDGPMTGGKNTIRLELLKPLADKAAPDKRVRFYQATGRVTPSDGPAFAPWTIPNPDEADWRAAPKSLSAQPAWLRTRFDIKSTDAPLWLVPAGLSKGAAVLNGRLVGRYWAQTRSGKRVHAEPRLYLPEPWLNPQGPNELMLFDEHGRTPEQCKLTYAP